MGKNKRKGTPLAPAAGSEKKQKTKKSPAKPAAPQRSANPDDMLKYLIGPTKVESFWSKYFEKQPLHVRASQRQPAENAPIFDPPTYQESSHAVASPPTTVHRFSHLFNKAFLSDALTSKDLQFGGHINVAKYHNGARETLTPEGPALPERVWELYESGATLQVFQPQQYSEALWKVIEGLETTFGCLVGCNAYLTPPNSQGLAPHHDDVEVFILQVEGRKRWRLYAPKLELPRQYSKDFDQSELGEPTHTLTMEEGDFMYFPRGVIHQAVTSNDHSTHLTISTYQRHAWFDVLSVALTDALTKAFETNRDIRAGLPINLFSFVGSAYTQSGLSKRHTDFQDEFGRLCKVVLDNVDLPSTVDQMSLDFIFNRLPPFPATLPQQEPTVPTPNQGIRWINPSHVRMVVETDEEGKPILELYHSFRNSRTNHMNAPGRHDHEREHPHEGCDHDHGGDGHGHGHGHGHGAPEAKDEDDEAGDGDEEKESNSGDDDDDDDDEEERGEHENDAPPCLSYPISFAPALAKLFADYPQFTSIKSLPIDDLDDKLAFATGLVLEQVVELK